MIRVKLTRADPFMRRVASAVGLSLSVLRSSPRFVSSLQMSHPAHRHAYEPPEWAKAFANPPKHGRLQLANLPTPLYQVTASETPADGSILKSFSDLNISLFIKRDDMSGGVETGGNKIRKLEFLLADALAGGFDSVATIGGEQSNHCRATAAAARMTGTLEPHLILRTRRADEQMGWTGNVLFDRMVGAQIYTCTPGEYGRVGSAQLVERVCEHLRKSRGKRPYPIPVGGSNALGTWGYINGVEELVSQWKQLEGQPALDHVVMACGSGGTTAGISMGLALAHGAFEGSSSGPEVHAVGVCDDPDYFYDHISGIARDMGLQVPGSTIEAFVKQNLVVHQGKGRGYAFSTQEELDFVLKFSLETGIVLDPVYTGKALYNFVTNVLPSDPERFRNKNVLFWHTGGALGLYESAGDLSTRFEEVAPARRLDLYGKKIGKGSVDISKEA